MERGERFYYIHRKLKSGACLPLQHFLDTLEVSRATFKRDLEYLRDRYGAPIVYDRDTGGYRYDATSPDDARFELPGLWFSPEELHGLLTMDALMQQMSDGLLGEPLQLLRRRLNEVLGDQGVALEQLRQRVRIFPTGVRRQLASCFPTVCTSTPDVVTSVFACGMLSWPSNPTFWSFLSLVNCPLMFPGIEFRNTNPLSTLNPSTPLS